MRLCPNCATSYDDDTKFCRNDGFRLPPPIPPLRIAKGAANATGSQEAAPPPPAAEPDLSPPRPGERIADRYRVEEQLGQGGFGVVYRCKDERFDAPVALKVLLVRSNISDDGLRKLRERFTAEAAALVRVNHPHLVHVLDAGIHRGLAWYAMQFVPGKTLSTYARERAQSGANAADDTLQIGLQLASALAAIHERRLVHLDVKPANILVQQKDGRPFITLIDLGVAEIADVTGSVSTLLRPLEERAGGTPIYMSPEQYLYDPARRLTYAADVYSTGVVLFQLLTGELPKHPPANGAADAWKVFFNAPAASVRTLRPDAPAALADVIDRCLLLDPARRPADGAVLRIALEQIAAPLPPTDTKGPEPVRRPRRWVALAMLAALFLLAAASLVVRSATIDLAISPSNAAVSIDGVAPPAALRPGPHQVHASAADHVAQDLVVSLWPFQHRQLDLTLARIEKAPGVSENRVNDLVAGTAGGAAGGAAAHHPQGQRRTAKPQSGSLEVQIDPPRANVLLDGLGVPLGQLDGIQPGQHVVAAELEGYERTEKKFEVIAGKTTPARIQLKKLSCEMSCSGDRLNLENPARQYVVHLSPGTTKGRKAEFGLFLRRKDSDGRLWDLTSTSAGAETTIPGAAQLYVCSRDPGQGGGCSSGCVAASPVATFAVDDATAALSVTCR